MQNASTWRVQWLGAMNEVDREAWDRLALPLASPLMEWRWLHLLEASGSISPALGWQPRHLTLWDGRRLVAAAPLYIKTHSEGEFVFDHWWAQVAESQGIDYYPKLVGMSPATPSVGYRFLVADDVDAAEAVGRLFAAIDAYCREARLSGCHLNFVDRSWFARWPQDGFIGWRHQSYLWRNRDFHAFDDYLKRFNASQRRNIRRECRSMSAQGIEIRPLYGDAISPAMAETMYRFYLNTNARYGPWAARFLNRDFFDRVFRDYRRRLLLMAAYRDGASEPVALSMLLVKDRHLIGRYWGGVGDYKDLHFNMCFYAPIRWAIAHGIRTFDPGAGSPHKIYRGFRAVANTSLHRFYHPRMAMIFRALIDEVNAAEQANIEALNRHLPFAKTNAASGDGP
jgi:predicted N-acyltransferase